MIKLPEQNTPEWLEWRKEKIGASDIPIIMGVSPYCTPLILWKRKLGFEEAPPMHPGMIYGHENESVVREKMQVKLGMRFDPMTMQHPEYEWATASLDGYNQENHTIIEIKSCNATDHALAMNGEIPPKYMPQLQWQMMVAQVDKVFYCSSHKDQVEIVEVKVDEEMIKKIVCEATLFYESLQEYNPPAHSERDHIEIDDPEFGKAAIAWQKAKETLNQAKEQEKFFRDTMIYFTDDGNCQGYGVRLTRVNQKGNVDWDKVCEEYKIEKKDLDKFRKEQIGFWKVSVIKER